MTNQEGFYSGVYFAVKTMRAEADCYGCNYDARTALIITADKLEAQASRADTQKCLVLPLRWIEIGDCTQLQIGGMQVGRVWRGMSKLWLWQMEMMFGTHESPTREAAQDALLTAVMALGEGNP